MANAALIEVAIYYLIAINLLAFLAFGYDKMQAQTGGWRLRESSLASFALFGGFVGAFAGRALFRHKTRKQGFAVQLWGSTLACLLIAGGGAAFLAFGTQPRDAQDQARMDHVMGSVRYAGCDEVRAAGKAPLHYGEPGYDPGMDGDGDGIACEPIF